MPTLYEDLEIAPQASAEEIRKQFKKLSLQYHPDKNPDPSAQERFVKISTAYEKLGDPEKRKRYDAELLGGRPMGGGMGGEGFDYEQPNNWPPPGYARRPAPPSQPKTPFVLIRLQRALNIAVAVGVAGLLAATLVPELVAQQKKRRKELARRDRRVAQMVSRNKQAKVKAAKMAKRNQMAMGAQ